MATVDFIYDYPYIGNNEKKKFGCQWSENRERINGSYTYPMKFNNTVHRCKHLKIYIEIENTGYGSIYDIEWEFLVCKANGSWVTIESFTLPETGEYTVDCDINNLDISMFAFVPSSNPGSNRTWDNWYSIEQLVITEQFGTLPLSTGEFHNGIYPNNYGIKKDASEVYVNIDGVLKKATDVLVNYDGALKSVPPVYSDHYISESESVWLYGFTPDTNGKYRIKENRISGDHELRLYSSDFKKLYDGYFYDRSFELKAGVIYYILVSHYYSAETSESYLQIYKED